MKIKLAKLKGTKEEAIKYASKIKKASFFTNKKGPN